MKWHPLLDRPSRSASHKFVRSTIFMCTFRRCPDNSIRHRTMISRIEWTHPTLWSSTSHTQTNQVKNFEMLSVLCSWTTTNGKLNAFQIYLIWCWWNVRTFFTVEKLPTTMKLISLFTFLTMVPRWRWLVRTSINGIQCGIWSQVWTLCQHDNFCDKISRISLISFVKLKHSDAFWRMCKFAKARIKKPYRHFAIWSSILVKCRRK